MASVHRIQREGRKSSPYWYARFGGADGRQYCKSTKKTKKADALAAALEFERLARGHTTEAHYRRVASELYERASGKPLNFHSCGQWLGQWLQNTEASVSPGTYEKYRGTITDFRSFLGQRDAAPLASMTPEDVVAYRDELQNRGLAASTINLAIHKTVGAAFEAAKRQGYLTLNPCAAVKGVKDSVVESKARRQPFTEQELESLLATTRETDWEGAILCGASTGLRLGDVANLTWQQVDLQKRLLRVTARKTGEELLIPLHPAFEKWLKKQTRGIGKAPVFGGLYGRKPGGCNGLSANFKRLMDAAGVVGAKIRRGMSAAEKKKKGLGNKARTGRPTSTLSFHSLRHTATSMLANAGVEADKRMAITGHKDSGVHSIYTHHRLDQLRQAVELIPLGLERPLPKAAGKKLKQGTKRT